MSDGARLKPHSKKKRWEEVIPHLYIHVSEGILDSFLGLTSCYMFGVQLMIPKKEVELHSF